jgi:dethiobiotin synthetase
MKAGYFVSGIGTNVGKTFVSAGLMLASNARYFKPIQTGAPDDLDRETVRELTGLDESRFLPEVKAFRAPLSPHRAAMIEGQEIRVGEIALPKVDGPLVVEGAGGLLVPLNTTETMLDLMVAFGLPVVLVSTDYLGSINHTLLSLRCLKQEGIEVAGVVFTGRAFEDNAETIARFAGQVPIWPRLPHLEMPYPKGLSAWAQQIKQVLPAMP